MVKSLPFPKRKLRCIGKQVLILEQLLRLKALLRLLQVFFFFVVFLRLNFWHTKQQVLQNSYKGDCDPASPLLSRYTYHTQRSFASIPISFTPSPSPSPSFTYVAFLQLLYLCDHSNKTTLIPPRKLTSKEKEEKKE